MKAFLSTACALVALVAFVLLGATPALASQQVEGSCEVTYVPVLVTGGSTTADAVVPTGERWDIHSSLFEATMSAVAGTRALRLSIHDASGAEVFRNTRGALTANQSAMHEATNNASAVSGTPTPNQEFQSALPRFTLEAGWTLRNDIVNVQVGDVVNRTRLVVCIGSTDNVEQLVPVDISASGSRSLWIALISMMLVAGAWFGFKLVKP